MSNNPWYLQAKNDFAMAELAVENSFYAQACYHSSQAAEKALKGVIIELGGEVIRTHALPRLKNELRNLGVKTEPIDELRLNYLTRMNTSTRYPEDELPPSDLFDKEDGCECLKIAAKVLEFVETLY